MKSTLKICQTICLLLFLSSINVLSAKEITVENPPFSISYNNFIEVEKVVLRDDATILHLKANSHPDYWFRIVSETYIRANGEKLLVKSADGIELDAEIFSEPVQFTLTFPPIDKRTERIDFIESDCSNCFKVWGIELKSPVLTNRAELPAEIKNFQADTDETSPLEVIGFKSGNAIIKGQLLGYMPDLQSEITVYVNNPVTGIQEEYQTRVQNDGRFEIPIPVVSTMQILFQMDIPDFSGSIVVSPNEETIICFDLQQKACQESNTRIDKCEKSKWVYFGGANAGLNNQYFDAEISSLFRHHFNYDKFIDAINGMSPNEYKAYMLEISDKVMKDLNDKQIAANVKELATLEIRFQTSYFLAMGSHFLESAHRKANNLDYRSELVGYDKPVFDLAYYDFMKQMPYNDLKSLYSGNYAFSINETRFIKYQLGDKIRYQNLTVPMIQQLAAENDMTTEELLYVDYFINFQPENWSKEKLNATKKAYINYADNLLNKQDLSKKEIELANQLKALSKNKKSNAQEINDVSQNLTVELIKSGKHNPEEIALKDISYKGIEKDTLGNQYRGAFYTSYQEQINALLEEEALAEEKKILADIVGMDKGLLFDLIMTQAYAKPMEESMPLTEKQLQKIGALENKFYLAYLTEKNNELLVKIEENKKKGGYIVHALSSDLTNEQLFDELRKPFKGKVVYVNFWETWCGPCRMGMKQFKDAKETFKGKDVAFVYVASERSPKGAWQNMIPDIWGEHYRLTQKQFEYLKDAYKIDGVPTYFIFDKEGNQIFYEVGFDNMTKMEKIITEALE